MVVTAPPGGLDPIDNEALLALALGGDDILDEQALGDERAEAIDEFDGHLDGSGEESELPTPEPTEVADKSDEKTVTRSE